mgnify:CR=1 FL=1
MIEFATLLLRIANKGMICFLKFNGFCDFILFELCAKIDFDN